MILEDCGEEMDQRDRESRTRKKEACCFYKERTLQEKKCFTFLNTESFIRPKGT